MSLGFARIEREMIVEAIRCHRDVSEKLGSVPRSQAFPSFCDGRDPRLTFEMPLMMSVLEQEKSAIGVREGSGCALLVRREVIVERW